MGVVQETGYPTDWFLINCNLKGKNSRMYAADMIMAVFQVSLLVLGPLLLPAFLKKWIWFSIVGISYLLYAGLGVLLFRYEDVESFGTLYGIVIPLVIGGASIAGIIAQLIADRLKKSAGVRDSS